MKVVITARPIDTDPHYYGEVSSSRGATIRWRALLKKEPGGYANDVEFQLPDDIDVERLAGTEGHRQVVHAIGVALDAELGTTLDPERTELGDFEVRA